ncbi:hypothetical protein AAG570_001057 [Ranatra chinensis]|uniref:Peptidase S1 domain-containing protein n=1 Tax=Ranatra chinensis TaxID=642074 RepID=A0ABD0YCM3_9HEMI
MIKISTVLCLLAAFELCASAIRERRSYLLLSSEEVDSSEFGGPPGPTATTCNCGWRNKNLKKIVGGKETQENEFPLIAALIDKYTNFLLCGSAIITPYHALSGAHCTWRRRVEGDPISIVIGEHDIRKVLESSNKEVIDVARIIEHPKFHRTNLMNDIAVLVLAKKIEFNKLVGPACWGATKKGGDGSPVLKKVNVRVVPLQTCSYNYPGRIPTSNPIHVCTYGRNRGSCQGDSGGPVVWVDPQTNRYTLIGLVSFGTGCGGTAPTVNTDVFSFIDWIKDTVKGRVPYLIIHEYFGSYYIQVKLI